MFPRRSSQEDADDDRELTKFDSKDIALLEESHLHSASWLAKIRWPLLIWVGLILHPSIDIADIFCNLLRRTDHIRRCSPPPAPWQMAF
jgi:hypothetical protein